MERDEPGASSGNAERLFAEYLVRREAGEDVDLDAFCAQHPEHADRLRALHRDWTEVAGVLDHLGVSGSTRQRLQQSFGEATNVDVTLPGDEVPAVPEDVVERLAGRRGAYGRYRLHGEVARGGMGAILKVWDEDLRRNLAMKVVLGKAQTRARRAATAKAVRLPRRSEDPGRFLEEAQVTAQLDHPGIVPVHELGLDADGQVYFTMKLVKARRCGRCPTSHVAVKKAGR